jgi:uncharacterized protein
MTNARSTARRSRLLLPVLGALLLAAMGVVSYVTLACGEVEAAGVELRSAQAATATHARLVRFHRSGRVANGALVAEPKDAGDVRAIVAFCDTASSVDVPALRDVAMTSRSPLAVGNALRALGRLDAAAKAAGLAEGEKTLEPMQPWLASLAISNAAIIRAGYDPQSGIERTLLHDEATSGKSIHGFESLQYQLRFFADMDPPLQVEMVRDMLREFDKGPALLDAMVDWWLRGDVAAAARYGIADMRRGAPALYRVLIVQRNEAWADQIATMLQGYGVSFVAVGFLHFAGPDSVLHALAQRGVHVERVAATQ